MRTIGTSAFEEAEYLGKVTFSEGLTSIGENAFAGTPVGEVLLPDSLTLLGDMAFARCKQLKEVSFGAGLDRIGQAAFMGCGFESLRLPGTVRVVGASAFSSCSSLITVVIEDGVTTLETWAFMNCSLYKLYLPRSLTTIETGVIVKSNMMRRIYYRGSEEEWQLIDFADRADFTRVKVEYNYSGTDVGD